MSLILTIFIGFFIPSLISIAVYFATWKILGMTSLVAAVMAGLSMFWGFRVAGEYTKDLQRQTEQERKREMIDMGRTKDRYSKKSYDEILMEINRLRDNRRPPRDRGKRIERKKPKPVVVVRRRR